MSRHVAVIVGSRSDLDVLKKSKLFHVFRTLGISAELSVISAHRNPGHLSGRCELLMGAGTRVFIAAAGLAAALPGAIAAATNGCAVVLGVALSGKAEKDGFGLRGLDAGLAQIRMPPGRPVMFCGFDEVGLKNAALAAAQVLAVGDEQFAERLKKYQSDTTPGAEFAIDLEPFYEETK